MSEKVLERNRKSWRDAVARYGSVVVVYLLLTWLTGSNYMGDTVDYVSAIQAFANNQPPNPLTPFWEFGHLLWRPLGWLLSRAVSPLTNSFTGGDERANILYTLIALNWVTGLACVVLLCSLLARFCHTRWATLLTTIGFILTQAFLNYFHTGCSYVPGLAFLLLGLWLLARDGDAPEGKSAWLTGTLVGVSFALAVELWFLYVLAMPGALAFPLLMYGANRRRRHLLLIVLLVAGVTGALTYGAVMAHLGIDTLAELKAWASAASHGLLVGGVSRMIYGFARSFVDLGNYGMLFKRYWLHDAYNPLSFGELFRASLWKLMLFYLFLAALLYSLWQARRGRQLLWLLMAGGIPVIAFACFWGGTVPERYMPLFPFLFLALGVALESRRAGWALKAVAAVLGVTMIFTNFAILSKAQLARQERTVAERIGQLRAASAAKGRANSVATPSMVIVIVDEELRHFGRDFPLNQINLDFSFYAAVMLGSTDAPVWRQKLAREALRVWDAGGDVWVSKRLLSERPRAEWNWVEGDDRRVAWADLPAFFSQLETQGATGGDGFLLIAPTSKNRHLLSNIASDGHQKSAEEISSFLSNTDAQ